MDFDNINFDVKYDPHLAYARSKLYNVLFTRALASKINDKKGIVVSIHPGVVRTDKMLSAAGEGYKKTLVTISLYLIYPLFWLLTKSCRQGASNTLFVLLEDNLKNGSYYMELKEDR